MGQWLDQLREDEAEVYPALLFLAQEIREDIAALHAFHLDTGNIAYRVSEPMPGEIRLQWWREVLAPEDGVDRSGEAAANPLAGALLGIIEKHDLPREGFANYLDARVFDLYNDAMADRTTLEAYFGETDSFIASMTTRIAGYTMDSKLADACGHGGVATGIAQRLRLLARDTSAGRTYLPEDLLASAGIDRQIWLGEADERHEMAVAAYRALGMEHAKKAIEAVRILPKQARALFLPVVLARSELAARSKPSDILKGGLEVSPLRRQWALWKAVIAGL